MVLRGYKLENLSHFYFIPPWVNEPWLRRLEVLNEMGKMLWPCPAGFYCLVMRKVEPCDPTAMLADGQNEFYWASA